MWTTAIHGILVASQGGSDAFLDIINRVENTEWYARHRELPQGARLMEKMSMITTECDDTTWNPARIWAHHSKMEHKEPSNYVEQMQQENMSMVANYSY